MRGTTLSALAVRAHDGSIHAQASGITWCKLWS